MNHEYNKNHKRELVWHLKGLRALGTFGLSITAVVSAYMTGHAVVQSAEVAVWVGFAVFFALFAIFFVGWRYMYTLVPRLRGPSQWAMAGASLGLLLAIAIGVSSTYNAAYLGGTAAVDLEIQDHQIALARLLERESDNTALMRHAGSALDKYGLVVEDLAEGEKNGVLSGTAGEGKVYRAMRAVAERLWEENARILSIAAERDQLIAAGRDLLSGTHLALNDALTPTARQARYRALAERVNDKLVELAQQEPADVLRESAARIGAHEQIGPRARGEGMREVANVVQQTRDALEREADELAAGHLSVQAMPYRAVSPQMAVWVHAESLVPVWLAAVGIDLFPLVLLLLIVTAQWQVRYPYAPQPEPDFELEEPVPGRADPLAPATGGGVHVLAREAEALPLAARAGTDAAQASR